MKKIGILTFQNSRNYGAVLQAYALAETVRTMGYDAEIIDYRCEEIEKILKLWNGLENGMLFAIKQFLFRWRKKAAFDFFLRRMPVSEKKGINKSELREYCKKYSSIIVGSDQIWNMQYLGENHDYFLNFYEGRKIAYSASAGDKVLLGQEEVGYIRKFDNISVREELLQQYLEMECEIKTKICCDPTILIGGEWFVRLAAKRLLRHKYIFLFMISESEELIKTAYSYATRMNCTVISNKNCIPFLFHCSPTDFLSWIYYAECIFTNSYHGTIFSILFHKEIYADIGNDRADGNTRIIELLKQLDMEECIICEDGSLNTSHTDYCSVENKLEILRRKSKEWLQNALAE